MAGLALALVVIVAFQVVSSETSKCGHGRWGGSARAEVNGLRIHDLQEQLTALQEVVEHRKEIGQKKIHELNELEDRVHDLEGTGCPKGHFACGGDTKKCLVKTMVCDHEVDCDNGADESEENCFDIAHAGAVLEGDIYGEHCSPHSNPTHIKIAITGEKRLSWFPSVEDITAHIDINYADGHAMSDTFHGKYFFGTHSLVIYHGEGHRAIDIVCKFKHGKDDHCFAEFVREDDLEVCGRAVLHAH